MKRRGFLQSLFGACAGSILLSSQTKAEAPEKEITIDSLKDGACISSKPVNLDVNNISCQASDTALTDGLVYAGYGNYGNMFCKCHHQWDTDIKYFMKGTASRGTPVSRDHDNVIRQQKGNEPLVGVLLNNVVELDLTRHPFLSADTVDTVDTGSKVQVLTYGEIEICIKGAERGHFVFSRNGLLTTKERRWHDDNRAAYVGMFLTSTDANGYARVRVNI